MILSQFVNRAVLRNKVTYSLPLIFTAALLPDLDFLFYPLIQHHTLTHSLTFWAVVYLPLLAIFRIKVLPYFIATLSHFMIGDVITGDPPLLYGISNHTFGLVRPWIVSQTGDPNNGVLFQSLVDALFVLGFAVIALVKRNQPSIFSKQYDLKHVLILGTVMFGIFIGAYRSDIVYAAKAHEIILYYAFAILAASQLAFFGLLAKGVYRKRPSEFAKTSSPSFERQK